MKRRWIIRGFLIAVILFFGIEVMWSIDCCRTVSYGGSRAWGIEFCWGEIHLGWEPNGLGLKGWNFNTEIAQDDSYPAFERFGQVQIPFWCPYPVSAFSAVLLWLVWRKNCKKPRGFPIEVQDGGAE